MLLLHISKNRHRCHRGVCKSHMRIVCALQAKVFHLPYYNIDGIKRYIAFLCMIINLQCADKYTFLRFIFV